MKALGIALMALPFIAFILCGLIFDTVDFLIAMGVIALTAVPFALGAYLLERAGR